MRSAVRRFVYRAILGTALLGVLVAAGIGAYLVLRPSAPAPPPPGCQAGTGAQAVSLEVDQAGIAATIAGIAARRRLPRQAVTIAYATALQESQLQDLDYGDRDSVGVFQQRPSQGWGPAADLENPVYATGKFFDALVRVHDYTTLPVDVAAQAVQRSADGGAYEQWAAVAADMAASFTGASPHGVSCWYTPAGRPDLSGPDLTGAVHALTQTFGPQGAKGIVARISTTRSADKDGSVAVVHVRQDAAWTVAGWLVAHAEQFGLPEVRYAGYEWKAADGSMGWQTDSGSPLGSIVAG